MKTQGTTTLTKRRLALNQLSRSRFLLVEHGDEVSALTLAAAAEEILGKIAARKGHYTSLDDNADWWITLAKHMGVHVASRKEFINALNSTRNELKHNDGGKNKRVRADFEFEAQEMIIRAIHNYLKAFGCLPGNKKLQEFYWNWRL